MLLHLRGRKPTTIGSNSILKITIKDLGKVNEMVHWRQIFASRFTSPGIYDIRGKLLFLLLFSVANTESYLLHAIPFCMQNCTDSHGTLRGLSNHQSPRDHLPCGCAC